MPDTETFCSPRVTAIDLQKQQSQQHNKMDTGYFQKMKVNGQPSHIKQLPPSSTSIWSMIHAGGGNTAVAVNVGNTLFAKPKVTAIPPTHSKDLVALMNEQLQILTTDLVQERQKQCSLLNSTTTTPHREPPDNCSMDPLWNYLESMNRRDRDDEEALAAPIYFSCDDMRRSSSPQNLSGGNSKNPENSPKSSFGFLPATFNSIRNLVGNVLRLPSLLLGTLVESNPASPEHYSNANNNNINRSRHHRDDVVYFDVDDIDFLPEDRSPTTTTASDSDESDDTDAQYEAFFLDEPHNEPCVETEWRQQKQNYAETKDWLSVNESAHGDVVECVGEERECNGIVEERVAAASGGVNDDGDCTELENRKIVPEITKATNPSVTAIAAKPTNRDSNTTKSISSPVDIVKGANAGGGASAAPNAAGQQHLPHHSQHQCQRRFISTPEQEGSRMSVVRPRRRMRSQSPKAVVVTRSTPIAMKRGGSSSSRRMTVENKKKNRKEKRKSEISHNMHEDFDITTEEEEEEEDGDEAEAVTVGHMEDDDDLLPLTARNLMEPSCLLGFCDSSMNSSTASSSVGGGRSAMEMRRNSVNFQGRNAAAYEREFPPMRGGKEREREKEAAPLGVLEDDDHDGVGVRLVKRTGGVSFEIPNSPQRKIVVAPKVTPQKQRTTSVVTSSSMGSSVGSSCGKFWGGCGGGGGGGGRRTRTVSEDDDDLIEFVSEGGTTYEAEVFSDDDDDEDYSSDEETESEEEDEDEEEETESETEDSEDDLNGNGQLQGHNGDTRRRPTLLRSDGQFVEAALESDVVDLPDSGMEEKKVRFGAKPQVRMLCTWDYAHRQARKGHWEEVGRDRVRFAARIRRVEAQLKPVLGVQHRDKVFSERFSDVAPLR